MYIRPFTIFLTLILFLSSKDLFACSFYRAEPFKPPIPSKIGTGEKPNPPKVTFELVRGKLGDGNSCDDTGVVKLLVEIGEKSYKDIGYSVEVIENTTGQELFPDYGFYTERYINGKLEFYFPWVDGATEVQEPVKIVFKLYALSPTWAQSEPVLITIRDEGKFWH